MLWQWFGPEINTLLNPHPHSAWQELVEKCIHLKDEVSASEVSCIKLRIRLTSNDTEQGRKGNWQAPLKPTHPSEPYISVLKNMELNFIFVEMEMLLLDGLDNLKPTDLVKS